MAISQPNQVGSSPNFQDNFLRVSQDDPTQQDLPNHPQLQPGTINILQVWSYSWCTSNPARGLRSSIPLKNDIQCRFIKPLQSRILPLLPLPFPPPLLHHTSLIFLAWNIFRPNQVRSSRNFYETFFTLKNFFWSKNLFWAKKVF